MTDRTGRSVTEPHSAATIRRRHDAPQQYAGIREASQPASQLDDDTLIDSCATCTSRGVKSRMAIWRWQRDPRVQFSPPDLVINNRNYWKASLRRWKAKLMPLYDMAPDADGGRSYCESEETFTRHCDPRIGSYSA